MNNRIVKGDSIKSKKYIELLKDYLQTLRCDIKDIHLLFFILGINLGLKSKELLSLEWNTILNNDYSIKDYIVYNEYKLYLNKSCKKIISNYICKYDLYCKNNKYVFGGNSRHMVADTFIVWYGKFTEKYNLSIHITTESLRKTFIYWQIKEHGNDPVKMYKLQDMVYRDRNNIYDISQYTIENDYNYFNDVNL